MGRIVHSEGYRQIFMPGHPNADHHGYVFEHVLVCEEALGKPLPSGSRPHHVNEKRDDNRPENLVLCQDLAYHKLLHRRLRALRACGHPSWRKCKFCKKYDEPSKLYIGSSSQVFHRRCHAEYEERRKRKNNSVTA